LKQVEMLAALSDAELWELANAGSWVRVEPGATIVAENAQGHSFFFLANGQVKVIRQARLLNMIDHGEFFGEMAFIRGGSEPRHATVQAMTESLLAEFEPESLAKMTVGAQLHLTRALTRNLV